MTLRFTEKLGRLPETVGMMAGFNTSDIENAIRSGKSKHAIAVGSGGSAIAAEFFARCRETLSHGPTSVQTPMQLVLGVSDISNSDIWLFSAGAENSDVVAAARAASSRRARSLHIVTRGPQGLAAREIIAAGGQVHAVPVAEEKDGYLATHSLIATIGALLLAADRASDDVVGPDLFAKFRARIADALLPEIRTKTLQMFETLDRQDTIIVIADPQLRPVSVLIETSAWEAGICPVQSTDFRNFAHGRHV